MRPTDELPFVPGAQSRPDRLREALEDCYRVDRLREFARALDLACFEAKYGTLPVWPSFDRAGATLKRVGLFVMPPPLLGYWRGYFIPDDLATRLGGFVPRPREETLAAVPEPVPVRADLSLVVAETEDAATREIFSVLQLIDRGGVPVSAQTFRRAVREMGYPPLAGRDR